MENTNIAGTEKTEVFTLKTIERGAMDLSNLSFQIQIRTNEDFTAANELLRRIKKFQKNVCDFFEPMVQAAHASWKQTTMQRSQQLDPLNEAESLVKNKLSHYIAEQEEKKRLEEARIEDQKRKEAEKLNARAQSQEEKGNTAKAEALREKADNVVIAAPIVHTAIPKAPGVSTVKTYTFVIEDDTKLPREYLCADMKKIGAVIRATKGTLQIPGVRILVQNSVRATAAAEVE
jgi:predicted ribosome quality control (RQC) complex YloA/Tae2 family protein